MNKFLWQVAALLYLQCIFVETITTTGGQVHGVILLILIIEKEFKVWRYILLYFVTFFYNLGFLAQQ